jgi:hypothetical protein
LYWKSICLSLIATFLQIWFKLSIWSDEIWYKPMDQPTWGESPIRILYFQIYKRIKEELTYTISWCPSRGLWLLWGTGKIGCGGDVRAMTCHLSVIMVGLLKFWKPYRRYPISSEEAIMLILFIFWNKEHISVLRKILPCWLLDFSSPPYCTGCQFLQLTWTTWPRYTSIIFDWPGLPEHE